MASFCVAVSGVRTLVGLPSPASSRVRVVNILQFLLRSSRLRGRTLYDQQDVLVVEVTRDRDQVHMLGLNLEDLETALEMDISFATPSCRWGLLREIDCLVIKRAKLVKQIKSTNASLDLLALKLRQEHQVYSSIFRRRATARATVLLATLQAKLGEEVFSLLLSFVN